MTSEVTILPKTTTEQTASPSAMPSPSASFSATPYPSASPSASPSPQSGPPWRSPCADCHPPLVRHPQQLLGGFPESLASHFGLFFANRRTISSTRAPCVLLESPEQRGGRRDRAAEARQHSGGCMRASSSALGIRPQSSRGSRTLAREQGGSSFSGAPGVGRHRAHGDAAVRRGVLPARRRGSR